MLVQLYYAGHPGICLVMFRRWLTDARQFGQPYLRISPKYQDKVGDNEEKIKEINAAAERIFGL
jgi:hypothetical protein